MTEYSKEQANQQYSRHFKVKELWSPDNRVILLENGFIDHLEKWREACGFPFYPNRCCSTVEENIRVRGHHRSLHLLNNQWHKNVYTGEPLQTCAIDLHRPDKASTAIMIKEALKRGFSVIVYGNHIHFDLRSEYINYSQIFDTSTYKVT